VIRAAIKKLADRAKIVLLQNEDLKNEAVYAWSDYVNKTAVNHHLVRVKVAGYPKLENFPHRVTERLPLDFIKCLEVKGKTGDFNTIVSRYDGDMPSVWWNFRRRKTPAAVQIDAAILEGIKQDVLSDGIINNIGPLETSVLPQAIESQTKAFYGPTKSEIYIEKVK
jgi:hypothetical protein